MSKLFKLSPSDLTFLYSECPRCFYLKVKEGLSRPRGIMPTIFIKIDGIMKDHFEGKSPRDIDPSLPAGKVIFGDRWLQSKTFKDRRTGNSIYLKGKSDTVLGFDDKSFGVVDFKTSSVKDSNVERYSRQLHSYALCLENAAEGKPALAPVSRLGLFVVEPTKLLKENKDYYFKNSVSWQEIPRNDEAFFEFLREVTALLSQDKIPAAGNSCSHCNYLKEASGYENYHQDIAI